MITSATRLYAVMGSPVSHSKGPVIHNAAFSKYGIDAVYLAFEPPSAKALVDAVKNLGICGASITIPFKEEIIPYLDAVHPDAREMGAVNTLVLKDGKITGYNTDCRAAVTPLLDTTDIRGKNVCIVGAGGAARAVAFGIAAEGANLVITNRSRERGELLARAMNARFVPQEEASSITADVVINTTSLGMTPDTDHLSFPARALHPGMIVMDVVYTPMETCLLKTAKDRGCTTIDGLSMFLSQAIGQFELWTGITPDMGFMRQTFLSHQGDFK